MTCTTVSWTVCAEAPGYMTLMAMAGGAIFGYWLIGKRNSESSPAIITTIANTQAKMGRSIKKRDMKGVLLSGLRYRWHWQSPQSWSRRPRGAPPRGRDASGGGRTEQGARRR